MFVSSQPYTMRGKHAAAKRKQEGCGYPDFHPGNRTGDVIAGTEFVVACAPAR